MGKGWCGGFEIRVGKLGFVVLEVYCGAAVWEPSLVEVLTTWSGVGQENGDFYAN